MVSLGTPFPSSHSHIHRSWPTWCVDKNLLRGGKHDGEVTQLCYYHPSVKLWVQSPLSPNMIRPAWEETGRIQKFWLLRKLSNYSHTTVCMVFTYKVFTHLTRAQRLNSDISFRVLVTITIFSGSGLCEMWSMAISSMLYTSNWRKLLSIITPVLVSYSKWFNLHGPSVSNM